MCKDSCQVQLEIVRSWLLGEHRECARWLVGDYMSRFDGARFDTLASGTPGDAITADDLAAVRALSIRFPRAFARHLERDDVRYHVREILNQIPSDVGLEDLSCPEFDRLLGPVASPGGHGTSYPVA
jgi:hypothetical protein